MSTDRARPYADIFRKNQSNILSAVTEPGPLAEALHSSGVIGNETRASVVQNNVPYHQRTSILLTAVSASINVDYNPPNKFKAVVKALRDNKETEGVGHSMTQQAGISLDRQVSFSIGESDMNGSSSLVHDDDTDGDHGDQRDDVGRSNNLVITNNAFSMSLPRRILSDFYIFLGKHKWSLMLLSAGLIGSYLYLKIKKTP
jgi:hypothetical protein